MNLKIRSSKTLNNNFIYDVLELDKIAYSEQLLGSFESVSQRFKKNTDSYILAYDNEKLVGYFCFFPVTDNCYKQILETDVLIDDDLTYDDVECYRKNAQNNIFIISVVISPQYRDGDAIRALSKGLAEFLMQKINDGYDITSLIATTVSGDGLKLLNTWNFSKLKDLDEGYQLFICEKEKINSLIPILKGNNNG